ncbi:MAG: stage V sporulation protein AA [Lachnospiraceae bacterium]|nr:stage V sporulation protein AA [Lachnospiraceae bacterium]
MADIIYLNLSPKMQTTNAKITVGDVAEITGVNSLYVERIKKLVIYEFLEDHTRQIVSCLKIVHGIQRDNPDAVVIPIGAKEVILEYSSSPKHNKVWEILKIGFVALISFFGTAFTIMAFHNDIGINDVFVRISALVTGEVEKGTWALELSYAIGLAVGILVFFNHVGKRKMTNDPTPLEVSMRTYEDDVNNTLTEDWERKGGTIDAP